MVGIGITCLQLVFQDPFTAEADSLLQYAAHGYRLPNLFR